MQMNNSIITLRPTYSDWEVPRKSHELLRKDFVIEAKRGVCLK